MIIYGSNISQVIGRPGPVEHKPMPENQANAFRACDLTGWVNKDRRALWLKVGFPTLSDDTRSETFEKLKALAIAERAGKA